MTRQRKVAFVPIALAVILASWAYSVLFTPMRRSLPTLLHAMLRLPGSAASLVTLDPNDWETSSPSVDKLRGWTVLGRSPINPKEAHDLLNRVSASVSSDWTDYPSCFEPRHALRVENVGAWATIVICFECAQMESTVGLGPLTLARDHMILSRDESAEFNKTATAHHLKIAPATPVTR